MLNYKDYEKKVYDWLISKHQQDSSFTFSLRQMGSKGAETDYFIGKEKSGYFSTTFWYLPVSFPGSSGDCLGLIFYTFKTGYNYHFELTQTKTPHNDQNRAALALVQQLQIALKDPIGFRKQPNEETKMFTLKTKTAKAYYDTVEEMFVDIEKDLNIMFPIVDEAIAKVKRDFPDFKANRITTTEFETFSQKLSNRLRKHENMTFNAFESFDSMEENDTQDGDVNSKPLNQILYGPPGTGKTYNTVLEAAKIITGNEAIAYDEALTVFKANLDNQIEFITFHQNYSYEDFIQGLRPDTENGSTLTFEKKDGVFKRIADRAHKNLTASENPASAKKEFDVVFRELVEPLSEEEGVEIEIKMKKARFFIYEANEKTIRFIKETGNSKHTLSINTLKKMYDAGSNDIIMGGLQPYYNALLEILINDGKSNITAVERKNYVIIIDEINRANISRVFGELITLIEEDKRSHGKIPMRVTLPSGDSFMVPSNLYIIGTMNTADKSIALLDIALRRRFEFVPMYPDVSKVKAEYQVIFEKMNKTIKEKKNYDFTIGHAYFMDDSLTLEKIINHKVIPLLLEYFMNSEEQVTEIMASAGIAIEGWPLTMKM